MIPAAGGAGAGRTRLRPPWARAIAVCLALASIAGGFGRGAAAAPGFTGLSELRPIYDDILNAQFASVDAGIARASGATPPEACQVLAATNLWWRIVLDPAFLA